MRDLQSEARDTVPSSPGGDGGAAPRTSSDVRQTTERLALALPRVGDCLAAGNERSAARRLRRFWEDYLAVLGPGERSGPAGDRPGLEERARRAREAGALDDDLAEALAAFAARERRPAGGADGDLAAAVERVLDLTSAHLERRRAD